MYDSNELPELVLGSRTQTPEAVNKVLEDSGYEALDVETQTDSAEETPAAAEETPADTTVTDSSVPSSENGGDEAAGGEEGETAQSGADSETAQQEQDQARPKKGGFKKKIGKLEREIEELRQQLADRSAAPAVVQETPLPEVGEEVSEPQLDDTDAEGNPKYASYEEFTKALSRWAYTDAKRQDAIQVRSARESKATDDATAQAETDAEAELAHWNKQLEAGKSKYGDEFEAVLKQSTQMPAEAPLVKALTESDLSAELVYHLATHKDELDRLNQLLKLPQNAPQLEVRRKLQIARREMDRLEAQLSSGTDTADHATTRSEEAPAAPRTEAARESRETVAPKPPAATPPQTPPKTKPEPMRPVGSRGAAGRKRLQDLTPDEMHSMDPDDLRKLVEA